MILVKVTDLNQDIPLIDVLIVEEMVKLDLAKAFLLFNKLVLNVMEMVKKSIILVMIVMDEERDKPLKEYQSQYLEE